LLENNDVRKVAIVLEKMSWLKEGKKKDAGEKRKEAYRGNSLQAQFSRWRGNLWLEA
jgi:hypothetical protein